MIAICRHFVAHVGDKISKSLSFLVQTMVLLGAIDQGTSSSRFLVFDADSGQIVAFHQVPK